MCRASGSPCRRVLAVEGDDFTADAHLEFRERSRRRQALLEPEIAQSRIVVQHRDGGIGLDALAGQGDVDTFGSKQQRADHTAARQLLRKG